MYNSELKVKAARGVVLVCRAIQVEGIGTISAFMDTICS